MDQRALAFAIGVHPKTVSRWENNTQPPEIPALELVATVLEVPVEWLRHGGDIDRPGGQNLQPPPGGNHNAVFESPVLKYPIGYPSFSLQVRAFINRFMAELADAGVSAEEEAWARRVLSNPDNIGYNVGGSTPTLDEAAMLRDIEGMSIGIRILLRNRGYKNLAAR